MRELEAAVLALAIEHHPGLLTESELIAEMTEVANPRDRTLAIENAVVELLRVGLLVRRDARLEPTPAALRAGEMEMGL